MPIMTAVIKISCIITILIGVATISYLLGAYSYPRNIWPIPLIREISNRNSVFSKNNTVFDSFGRLIQYQGKETVDCPSQTEKTIVLLTIGQSNVANHSEKNASTSYPNNVVNYHNGRCYVARSPLIGSSGKEGEFVTLIADKLIETGNFDNVVIVSSAIGGTTISRWQADGDLNIMMLETISRINEYKITNVIWHQGESDFLNKTSTKVYERNMLSLIGSLRNLNVNAPIHVGVSTFCGFDNGWTAENPVATALRNMAADRFVYVGFDADSMLSNKDRRADGCHLSESGQHKAAAAYVSSIKQYYSSR